MWKSWKLVPIIALATVLAVLVGAIAVAVYGERSYQAQKINEVTVQAQILASTVTAALAFNDVRAAEEYVNALKVNPEILQAGVYDEVGLLFAGFVRKDAGELPRSIDTREPYFQDHDLIVSVPVNEASITVGTVYLRATIEPVARRLIRYAGLALLATLSILVVVVLAFAHAALRRANAELALRAAELADTNCALQGQMEEREKAEEALRHSQKLEAIGQLSGGIAHDFNNLLTIIRGHLQMMERRLAAGETNVSHYIGFAMEGLNRAASVTQRILAFSRRQPLSPRPVNLSDLVLGMAELLGHSTGERIALETSLAAEWWTPCDPNQMENVILNLVINARDAMPEGGRLIIETCDFRADAPPEGFEGAPAGDYVLLSVVDTGIGMSADVKAKAIDPFFTTKPQGQGTGLGLSMIFGYVKQSQGHLRIDSVQGKGTRISILMPRHQDDSLSRVQRSTTPDPVPAPVPTAPAATDAPTILLVEDEFLVRMVAAETLRDAGYEVVEHGDGDAALKSLASLGSLDLLVTDVKLPGVSGYELAQFAVAHRPGLKILLMTGYAQDPLPADLAAAGIEVLYKPYNLEQMTTLVHGLLADRAARRRPAPEAG